MNEDVMLRADEKKINWYPGHMARAMWSWSFATRGFPAPAETRIWPI